MTEVVVQKEWYSVKQCQDNPDTLYVFGDNSIRKGRGGQAQIRYCKNSVGIATKRLPSMTSEAFFDDDTLDDYNLVLSDIVNVVNIHVNYKKIVFPADGLGTGLAKMNESAPKLYNMMNKLISEKFNINYR